MQPGDGLREPYTLEEFVGHGGQGECWLVREEDQRWLGKLYHLHREGWAPYELVERESSILRQISHPGIPTFRDAFVTKNEPNLWLLREWIPGQPLESYVEENRCGEQKAREVASHLLKILVYIHSLSPAVIHRDIKPSNIIVRPDQSLALIDFGSVRDALYLREGASVVGTYGYTPPEQFLGHPTPASDLYALGATLVYMLARRPPSTLPLSHNYLQFESYINVQPRFLRILKRLLAPVVEERFQSAQEVINALEKCHLTASSQNNTQQPPKETIPQTEMPSSSKTNTPPKEPKRVGPWQRHRIHAPTWKWEGYETSPLRQQTEYPNLLTVIQTLQERHKVEGMDEFSDPLEIVTAIDEHFGPNDETGRQCIVRLLHPHDAADLLLGYYEPNFLLPNYAKLWMERFSLLFTHTPKNSIGQWVLLYFLQKHGWEPQSDWYQTRVLRLQIQGNELLGLPKRMQRFLHKFEQLPIGKQAQQYDKLCAHWEQISRHFHLCSAIRPAHLTYLLKQGRGAFEKEILPSYSKERQENWHSDRLLRWSLRYLTAWPPNWMRLGAFFQKDANKYQKMGNYIATAFEMYASIDRLRNQLQEEYSWLLPEHLNKQMSLSEGFEKQH